jgi:NADH-quinone oxidoreductase subunit E
MSAPVNEILDRYPAERTAVLAVLEDIQAEHKYLPREALETTAKKLGMKLSDVYQLATFYKAFSLKPKGECIIKVCLGTACHVNGGPQILEAMEKELGIKAGGTTPDAKYSLEAVRCVGSCAIGPVVLVNEQPHGKMTTAKTGELMAKVRAGEAAPPAG